MGRDQRQKSVPRAVLDLRIIGVCGSDIARGRVSAQGVNFVGVVFELVAGLVRAPIVLHDLGFRISDGFAFDLHRKHHRVVVQIGDVIGIGDVNAGVLIIVDMPVHVVRAALETHRELVVEIAFRIVVVVGILAEHEPVEYRALSGVLRGVRDVETLHFDIGAAGLAVAVSRIAGVVAVREGYVLVVARHVLPFELALSLHVFVEEERPGVVGVQLLLGLGGSSQGVGAFCLARPLVEIGSLTVFDRVAREPYVVVGVLDALFVVCVQQRAGPGYVVYARRLDVNVDVVVEILRVERYRDLRCQPAQPCVDRRLGRIDRQQRCFAPDRPGFRFVGREVAGHLIVVPRQFGVGLPCRGDSSEILLQSDFFGISGVCREVAHVGHGVDPVTSVGYVVREFGPLRGLLGRVSFPFGVRNLHLLPCPVTASCERAVFIVPCDEDIFDFGDLVAFEAAGFSEGEVRKGLKGHGERYAAFALADRFRLRVQVVAHTGTESEQHAAQQQVVYRFAFHPFQSSV